MNSSRTSKPQDDLLDEVELLDEPGGKYLRLRFHGPFEGKWVNWQATLFTPDEWAKRFDEAKPVQNIIEILVNHGGDYVLNLSLNVAAIDRPTVRKAVMMVRQYRRLQRGRHCYGSTDPRPR